MRPALDVNIYDAGIGIWQDDARDPTFRVDVFGPLIRTLRDRGWKIGVDPHIKRRYRRLSSTHRLAARGTLRASIEVSGRVVKIEWWATTWPIDNRNGRRHDFNKLDRMTYLDRLRLTLERRRIVDWLRTIAPVTVKERNPPNLSPVERIARDYAESWHSDKTLGRPVCACPSNAKALDGQIEHGATVWFIDRKGRIGRGTAYYNINNMWWVVAGSELRNLHGGEIFIRCPDDLRTKRNERNRRARLEADLAAATRRMDFSRAELLRRILFGDAPVFLIWARDHGAYYRPNYSGYTTDTISAGKYTRAEAEREVRRVPHELEAHGPDGERIRFDKVAA